MRAAIAWILCANPRRNTRKRRATRRPFDRSALLEALEVADVDDRIRAATAALYQALYRALYQALIGAELTAVIGAAPHERTESRTAQRDGSRPRTLTTTAGDLELRIPTLRSFFPSMLWMRAGARRATHGWLAQGSCKQRGCGDAR